MSVHVEWTRATMELEGAACEIVGTGMASTEAGPGVEEALVARTDGSGVHPHKTSTGTKGGVGSRKSGSRVSSVLLQTGGKGTRVW